MAEPTAEHLKAAREWLLAHVRVGGLRKSREIQPPRVLTMHANSLAALLASRDTYCPSCGRPGECACLGNAVERADEAEQMVAELVSREQALLEKVDCHRIPGNPCSLNPPCMCCYAEALLEERDAAEAKFQDWSGTDVPALNIALTAARQMAYDMEQRAEAAATRVREQSKLLCDIADDATDGPINRGLNSVQAVLAWAAAQSSEEGR